MNWYEILGLVLAFYMMHRENQKMYRDLSNEMKDFHGRLCALEEKYIQMMERFMSEKK